jgi:DNA topoisomerase VI subunit A
LSTAKSQKARLGKVTAKAIKEVATNIDKRIVRMRKPEVTFPVRSLGNLRYDPRKGYFEIGNIMGTTFTLVAM